MVLNHDRTQDYLISTQLTRAFKTPLAPFTKRITLEKTVEKFRLSGHQQKDEYTMMENTDLRLKLVLNHRGVEPITLPWKDVTIA